MKHDCSDSKFFASDTLAKLPEQSPRNPQKNPTTPLWNATNCNYANAVLEDFLPNLLNISRILHPLLTTIVRTMFPIGRDFAKNNISKCRHERTSHEKSGENLARVEMVAFRGRSQDRLAETLSSCAMKHRSFCSEIRVTRAKNWKKKKRKGKQKSINEAGWGAGKLGRTVEIARPASDRWLNVACSIDWGKNQVVLGEAWSKNKTENETKLRKKGEKEEKKRKERNEKNERRTGNKYGE